MVVDQKEGIAKKLHHARRVKEEKAVESLMATVVQMANPFQMKNTDLISISTGVVASEDVKSDLIKAEEYGETAMLDFIKTRFINSTTAFHDPIKKMKLKTFSKPGTLKVTTKVGKTVELKADRTLFARLVIIGKSRNFDVKQLLQYPLGNAPFAIAASNSNYLVKTNKAKLLQAVENKSPSCHVTEVPEGSALIVDDMAILHSLPKPLPATYGALAQLILNVILTLAGVYKLYQSGFCH